MIILKDINKYYKSGGQNFHALKDINLKFGEKGMNFILGKSGSGKSTLLNVIGGIDSYDSGELIIDGVNTKEYTKKKYNTYRNTYIGFIFQEFNVLKGLSVYENIAISLELQHQDLKANADKIQSIIDKVGLTGLENRMMNQLSGGQRQRVAIARSLIKNPRVIIADEPTGNLDSKNSKIIMDLLKELSLDHLVIIVTHNDQLAKEYSDRTIEIKDGIVTKDTLTEELVETEFSLTPISVSTKTSLNLSIKAIFKSIKRFVFMILLFSIALIFAGVVINMSLADTTLTYSKYQDEFKNNVVTLENEFQSRGFTTDSAFYNFQFALFQQEYINENLEDTVSVLKGMSYELPIDGNSVIDEEFYLNSISYIYDVNNLPDSIGYLYTQSIPKAEGQINIFITDYLAENLIFQRFFGTSVKTIRDLLGKALTFDSINYKLVIKGILKTNYAEHKENFKYFNENATNDLKAKNAFFDNTAFYNAIFMDTTDYELFFSYENIKYFTNDVIYNMVADEGVGQDILFTTWPTDNNFVTNKNSKAPTIHDEGKPIQVAVTSGLFKKILNIQIDDSQITEDESKLDLLFNKIHYEIPVHTDNTMTEFEMVPIYASNFFALSKYIPTNLSFNITSVIDNDDEAIVYFAPNEDFPVEAETGKRDSDFNKLLKSTFVNGGFITLYIERYENLKNTKLSKTEYLEANSDLYREFINNNMNITNNSFTKVLLVDNFINDNLPLFIAVFFVFALFSILLIFNFVIINIKNSTRDIGIYMSLGFSGWKISLIYLFQVIILGVVAFIISLIGTGAFLLILDAHFTSLAAVNLSIIKMSIAGSLIVLLIALLTPVISVIIPLVNLSRKNPVDVIKTI